MLHFRASVLGFLLTLGLCLGAQATVIEMATLDDLIQRSDLIVEGKVLSAEGQIVSGQIQTTIRVQVADCLKGEVQGDSLEITQMGGVIEEPLPLAQAIPGLPAFAEKEDVVLFLSHPSAKLSEATIEKARADNGGELPALVASPQVVGGFQGKYNIYLDSDTKKRMVIRQSALAIHGVDPDQLSPEAQVRLAQSIQMVTSGTGDAANSASVLTSPPPATAATYEAFRDKVTGIIQGQAAAKAKAEQIQILSPEIAPDTKDTKAP